MFLDINNSLNFKPIIKYDLLLPNTLRMKKNVYYFIRQSRKRKKHILPFSILIYLNFNTIKYVVTGIFYSLGSPLGVMYDNRNIRIGRLFSICPL